MAFYENGKYAVRITDYVTGESKDKGTPFFRLYFDVLERVHGDGSVDDVPQQYEREATMYLIESCDWSIEATFEALGSAVSLDPHWLKGMVHEAYCISERGNDGKVHERWSFYRPGGGKRQDVKALSDRQRRDEEEQLKRRLGINTTVRATDDYAQEAAALGDDDIPF